MVDVSKYINEIKDETLRLYFYLSEYELQQKGLPRGINFLDKYRNDLKKIFPKSFDLFESKIKSSYIILTRLLIDTILLENGYYDPKNLNSINNIPYYEDFYDRHYSYYVDWRFYAESLNRKYITMDDVLTFIEENPIHFRFLLPLIVNKGSVKEYEYLNKRIQDAKLEDNIRLFIFENILRSNNVDCVRYFVNEIKKNNYFRFKALKELNSITGDYYTNIDIKKCIDIFEDAYNYNYEKYLNLDFQHNYYFLKRLKQFDDNNFKDYLKLSVKKGNVKARRAAFAVTMYRKEKEYYYFEDLLPIIALTELELEDFSLFPIIDTKKIEGKLADKLFNKFLSFYDDMDKVNYHYKMDSDITFARDISKLNMIRNCLSLAIKSVNKNNIKLLDERVQTMNDETLAYYLDSAKDYTKLDIRKEALVLLKTDNYSCVKFYNKLNINLTYDEAVTVSDYLKSKKENIKKDILNEYLKSNDKVKISEYLVASNVDYKVSIGLEMQQKLGIKKEITLVKPIDKINEILKENIDLIKLKSIDYKSVNKFFTKLKNFIEQYKNYEYKLPYSDNVVTLGSRFSYINQGSSHCINDLPLGELLAKEFKNLLTDEEYVYLALDLYLAKYSEDYYLKLFKKDNKKLKYYKGLLTTYEYTVANILVPILIKEYVDEETVLKIYLSVVLKDKEFDLDERYIDRNSLSVIVMMCKNHKTLYLWKYLLALFLSLDRYLRIDLEVIMMLFEHNMIDEEIIRYYIIKHCSMNTLTFKTGSLYINRNNFKYPKFKEFMLNLVDEAINVELNRGSSDTIYTKLLHNSFEYYGVKHYLASLYAIKGLTLVRGDTLYGTDKNVCISRILKNTIKLDSDTYDEFVSLVKKYKLTKEDLIKGCLYNQSFIDFTDKYLNILGFKSGVYYFMAHLNEELNENKIEILKEYSVIDYHDFKDGAFDHAWYEEISKINSKDFKIIYDNAKYITVGGLHKRAQRFFDAKNNKITTLECINKINESRNKDYVLIYSLIPIVDESDLIERFLFLQGYLKESKKFGQQRQLSERRVVDIALDNLARLANYNDTNLFIYEMEARLNSDYIKELIVDDIKIIPNINHLKITLNVYKDNKKISSIPSKLSKDNRIIEFKEYIKNQQEKLKRIVKSLEQTMCNEIAFDYEKFIIIAKDNIIGNVLSKLILYYDNKAYIYKDNNIYDLDGNICYPEKLYIAHPIKLKNANILNQCINYVIENNVKQPFKQVLREFYCKSEEELNNIDCWRFRGFNVDLKKCIAALKGKGWSISEDFGLRKVCYYSNLIAVLFREFDEIYTYDFNDCNKELHTITFVDRKTHEIVDLKDVDEVTYSEVLRDVDLMVSISSNAIYDYELAMSTTLIRQEILKSIISILRLDNVSFLKENIKIEGKFGSYLINIKTGMVFMEGKGNLLIKSLYSTNKALLLDFIDEDPMTADIISKAIVLSNDTNIKDPSILVQIK